MVRDLYPPEADDQGTAMLETDVMRFMAILGILFWIVFALIKSIPLCELPPAQQSQQVRQDQPQAAVPAPALAPEPQAVTVIEDKPEPSPVLPAPPTVQPEPEPTPKSMVLAEPVRPEPIVAPLPQRDLPKPVPDTPMPAEIAELQPLRDLPTTPLDAELPEPAVLEEPAEAPQPEVPQAVAEAPTARPTPAGPPEIGVQFASLDDLMVLQHEKAVRIFLEVENDTFRFLYEAERLGERIRYLERTDAELPHVLWEVQSGDDYELFVTTAQRTFPSIRNFPRRKVYVAFVDHTLEKQLESLVQKHQGAGDSGQVLVHRDRRVSFKTNGAGS